MPLDRALLTPYFSQINPKRHVYYDVSVKRADAFLPHSDGAYPENLIGERRPNEPIEVKDYRAKIWKPKTKPTFGRIISSLSKIRRSADWSIKYRAGDFGKIKEGESLEDYCEANFPYFESVTNWAFAILLKKYLTDPNAVCFVYLLNRDVAETDYKKPYPFIFDSKYVVEFKDDDYCILQDPAGAEYARGKVMDIGTAYYYIDTEVIERWEQVDAKGNHNLAYSYQHGTGEVPAFKLGAIIDESDGVNFLHSSRIADVLPELDEAVREYSDLQAAIVMHAYPERWEFTSAECPACNHTGFRPNPNSTGDHDRLLQCTFPGCNGGYIAPGPYSKIKVTPNDAGIGQSSPIPPAGFIEKDAAIIKLMQDNVTKHIYDGLSAINFQFLDQSPLNQSGTAKEVDKDELNNTVHAIAEDIVRILDNVYRVIARYRYIGLYSAEEIQDMLPVIPVPERFDILSANYLGEELDKGRKGSMNPVILSALELEYASKKFNADPDVRDRLELVLRLDPFPNVSQDDKMTMLSNKGITQESYVISSNTLAFVQRALDENEDFAILTLPEQLKKMAEYAQEIISAGTPSTDIIQEATDALQ